VQEGAGLASSCYATGGRECRVARSLLGAGTCARARGREQAHVREHCPQTTHPLLRLSPRGAYATSTETEPRRAEPKPRTPNPETRAPPPRQDRSCRGLLPLAFANLFSVLLPGGVQVPCVFPYTLNPKP